MSVKIIGVFVVILATVTGLFYWYYTDTQARIAILQENNSILQTSLETSEATVTALRTDVLRINSELVSVNKDFAEIRRQNDVLADKLEDHDLGLLAERKSGLMEKLVNNGTANAGRCLELLSGAPLNEKERNAKDGKEFNSECPWLFTPN